MADEKKIALFIDADNIPAKYGKLIIEALQSRGEIFIRRIYGNWEKNSLHTWNECILKYGLNAVQQMDFTVGKNATDMSLTIDAMDVLYQKQAEIFAIVSFHSSCRKTSRTRRLCYRSRQGTGIRVFSQRLQ